MVIFVVDFLLSSVLILDYFLTGGTGSSQKVSCSFYPNRAVCIVMLVNSLEVVMLVEVSKILEFLDFILMKHQGFKCESTSFLYL